MGNVFTCLKNTKDKGLQITTDIVDTDNDGKISQEEKEAAIGAIKDGVETVAGLISGSGEDSDDNKKKKKKRK